MYYRIADMTLLSQIELPSFAAFACEPAPADATLFRTDEEPCEGEEIISGNIVHRRQTDGWFCYSLGIKSYVQEAKSNTQVVKSSTQGAKRYGQGVKSSAQEVKSIAQGAKCYSQSVKKSGLLISSDYSDLRLVGSEFPMRRTEHYVRLALECLLIRRGYISIHAAAVELDGEAFAFTGPSGIGKSTRAQAWISDLDASLISGDRPLIRVDTLEVFGVPWDGKEGCFRSVRRKLKAICDVRRDGPCYARKLSVSQSRRLLLRQSFLPMWDTETAAIQMGNIFLLAAKGRILRIFGGVSTQEVKSLYAIIQREEYLEEVAEMKAKPGFILRNVVNEYMLMPTGENIGQYRGVVLLNSVSAFIWEKLQSPVSRDDLLAAVLHEFEVDEKTAAADLDALLQKLDQLEILEYD